MVSLSAYSEYLPAVPATACGDFASARSNLEALTAKIEAQSSPEQLAYVLQLTADVEAQAGNVEKALSLHERALAVDSSSPLTLVNCAKSLLTHLHLPALALARLQEAERLLASDTWLPHENDMTRQWYEHQIHAARQRALRYEP